MSILQVISDLSENAACLNGKFAALNKFINQLKELNNWVIQKKSDMEKINKIPLSEQKQAAEKLHVNFLLLLLYFINVLIS